MEEPAGVTGRPPDFLRELRCFPREMAAELNDHLQEAAAQARAQGADPAAAHREALRSLGNLGQLRRALVRAARSPLGIPLGMPWSERFLMGGWMVLGLLLLTRICAAIEPSFLSIGLSFGLGLSCTALGVLMLRGGSLALRWVQGGALAGILVVGLAWSALPVATRLGREMALQSWMLFAGMLVALLTSVLLVSHRARSPRASAP
ncbi:MAG: permease prefix domain 1-containing protein [Limisphaerales bacterium]